MNALTEFPDAHDAPRLKSLHVTETYWGYIIRIAGERSARWDTRQVLFLFLGSVFMAVALGLWLLPGANVGASVLPIKLALTAVFAGIGGLFIHTGTRTQRGMEVHVDTVLREMRFIERGRDGTAALARRIQMGDISSIYLTTEEDDAAELSHLLVQEEDTENPLHVATGATRDLRILRDRLKKDMRPAAERVERRLMRQAKESMAGQLRRVSTGG